MKPRHYTIHQVTEDLAMLVRRERWDDESVLEELRACPPMAERPEIRAALADVDAAVARALQVAAVSSRDQVAAWLAYEMAYDLLNQIDDLLVLAGVRSADARYQERGPSYEEWMRLWWDFVASCRAWEMRSC